MLVSPPLKDKGVQSRVCQVPNKKRSASDALGGKTISRQEAKKILLKKLKASLPAQCAKCSVWCVLNEQQETDSAVIQPGEQQLDADLLTTLKSLANPLQATAEHPDGQPLLLGGVTVAQMLASSEGKCEVPNMLLVCAEVARSKVIVGEQAAQLHPGSIKVVPADKFWVALEQACDCPISPTLNWQTLEGDRLPANQHPRVVLLPSPHSTPGWPPAKLQHLLHRLQANNTRCVPSVEEYILLSDKVSNLQKLSRQLAVLQQHQTAEGFTLKTKNEIPSIVPTMELRDDEGTPDKAPQRLWKVLTTVHGLVAGDTFWRKACKRGSFIVKPAFGSRSNNLFEVSLSAADLESEVPPAKFAQRKGVKQLLSVMQQQAGSCWLVQPHVPALAAIEYRVVSIGGVADNAHMYVIATARDGQGSSDIAYERFEKPDDWLVLAGRGRSKVSFENQRNPRLQKRLLSAAAAVQHALLAGEKRALETVLHMLSRLDFAYVSLFDEGIDEDRFIINEVDNTLNSADLLIDLGAAAKERKLLAQRVCQDILWQYAEGKDVRGDKRELHIRL